MKQPPAAVRRFMAEFDYDTPAAMQEYILDQLQFYNSLAVKHGPPEQWLGFKLGCSCAKAAVAIRWATEAQAPART